jgi:hypothetical protein
MMAQIIFLAWIIMITGIYGSVIWWLLRSVLALEEQMKYLYSLLEEAEYDEVSPQLEQKYNS